MPKKLSVIKRIAVAERNRSRNKIYKSTIKTLTKKYFARIDTFTNSSNSDQLKANLSIIYSKIDKAVNKGVLHQNNGARKKALLMKAFKKLPVQ
uniref:Ribosomal protein S20 n=1 Tax=Balbiania investiens TaxID=111861 RepID=A0A4D6BN79_9FLOR|nr:ribosomal protein S20 [Balbiania investiens]QBX88658.1 ribosomal protein S20 [Balbiania investiens]